MIDVYVNTPEPVEVETAGVGTGTYFTAEMPLQLSGGVLRLLLSTLVEEGSQLPVTADAVAQALKNYTPEGEPSVPGQDGFSPTVNVVVIDGGHRVTITDKDGDHVFDVLHGQDGAPGDSITVTSVTESTEDGGVNEVTFSDGTRITIKNGSKGDPGYTPEKGTDYYTEADKAELIDKLKEELPENDFSGSWNDLTDRPFGEEISPEQTITYDGSLDGYVYVEVEPEMAPGQYYVKLSESTPEPEVFIGTTAKIYHNGNIQEIPVSPDNLINASGAFIIGEAFILIPESGVWGLSAGIWGITQITDGEAMVYSAELTVPGTTVIHTIDPKYLPDSVKLTVTTTEKFRIEYDGNPDNKEVVALGTASTCIKLADEVYSEEVWIGGTITATASGSGNVTTHAVVEDDIVQDALGPGTGYMVANTFAVITGSDPDLSTGVWLVFPASLWEQTKNHTMVFESLQDTTVTKIDPKYIPDSVLMESEMGKIVDAVIDALPTAEGGSF